MINYNDYQKLLFPWNLLGEESNNPPVPGQTVNKIGNDHIITYSFFTSQSDIINSAYYDSTDEEAVKFISPLDYQQNIVDATRFLVM